MESEADIKLDHCKNQGLKRDVCGDAWPILSLVNLCGCHGSRGWT